MTNEQMIEFIVLSIEEVLNEEGKPAGVVDESTVIFGSSSILDSLGLVSLIVKLEDYLFETAGKEIQIVDDEALFSGDDNPLRTPALLAELILKKINAG